LRPVGDSARSYEALAAARELQPAGPFSPGPVTPLLTRGSTISPAYSGSLADGIEGIIGPFAYGRFAYNAVFARVPESQPFVPRLSCDRKGRNVTDEHYGFEVRSSRLWTESIRLNDRFEVQVSPFQDDSWLRQLFSPTFVDWLADSSPSDFSFELAYGSLFCSVESDEPDAAALTALWNGAATVAKRIHEESRE
jgi:hypothetical protein